MKIAVVSNLFPPVAIGGYEVGISWMVESWRADGHEVTVYHLRDFLLFGSATEKKRYKHQSLGSGQVSLGFGFIGRPSSLGDKVKVNLSLVVSWFTQTNAIHSISQGVDVVIFGNPLGVPLNFLERIGKKLSRKGIPYRAFVSDQWVATWPHPDPLSYRFPPSIQKLRRHPFSIKTWIKFLSGNFLKFVSAVPPRTLLDFRPEAWICCSDYVRETVASRLVDSGNISVNHWRIPFHSRFMKKKTCPERGACFAFGGQALKYKGIGELLGALQQIGDCHLHIFSDLNQPGAVDVESIPRSESFSLVNHGLKTPSEFFEFLDTFKPHVVVPSQWDEPFSIIAVQAVVAGCRLTITPTGGSVEWKDLDSRVVISEDLTSSHLANAILSESLQSDGPRFDNNFQDFARNVLLAGEKGKRLPGA